MSRLALFILLLHLSLNIHAADPERTGSAYAPSDASAEASSTNSAIDHEINESTDATSDTGAETSSTSSDGLRGDLSDTLSMDDPSLKLARYADHVDISGMESYAAILGISADPNNRSALSSLLRWGAKQSGSLQPDIAGVGSLTERQRTERTLGKFETMLTAEEELNPETLRQALDRQAAAMAMGVSLLKALQSSNSGKSVPDILMKIQAAQQLLTVNEQTIFPPTITVALTAALAIARDKTTHQMHPHKPEE